MLYHESDLDPEEHYTDTHGDIALNFAAFPMFGKRVGPRIRGLHRQWIYRIDLQREYGPLCQQQRSRASCLVLILAAIISWQIRAIDTVLRHWDPDEDGVDASLLPHMSPSGWDNIVLYGEYALDRGLVSRRPSRLVTLDVEN